MRRAAAAFVLVTIALDMLALGIIIPVLPRLVVDFMGGDAAKAARTYSLFGATWALMQFVFSPVLGRLSDRYGRRPVILISNVGLGLDYVLMALAPNWRWLLLGRAISGICASSISAANAYVADVTPPARRAAAFGLVGAASGVGFVLGPAVGGLLGTSDPRLPFWAAAALSLANALYGVLVLPESLPRERRVPFAWARANPLASLALLRSRPGLLGLAAVYFLNQLAHVVLPSTFVLYVDYRYGWDARSVGLSLALIGICSFVVQGWLVRLVARRLGDRRTALVGLACGIAAFALAGVAPSSAVFFGSVPLLALWGLAGAALQSLMSGIVGADQQGQLQGANSSLAGMAALIGPVLFPLTFAAAVEFAGRGPLVGAPFLLAAALVLGALVLAARAGRPSIVSPLETAAGE